MVVVKKVLLQFYLDTKTHWQLCTSLEPGWSQNKYGLETDGFSEHNFEKVEDSATKTYVFKKSDFHFFKILSD